MNVNRLGLLTLLLISPCVLGLAAERSAGCSTRAQHMMSLALKRGDRIWETTVENDRIEWQLPKRRLDDFRRSGVIIEEERRTTTQARAVVMAATAREASLHGSATLRTFDVPRNLETTASSPFSLTIDARNARAGNRSYSLQEAAMVQLPVALAGIGQSWSTREKVWTELGSGEATFTHTLTSAGRLVAIRVRGAGAITGAEYHLPKLLPGSMRLDGFAWYDRASKLITRERYAIDNRLTKPDGSEMIGFHEKLTVAVDTRLLTAATRGEPKATLRAGRAAAARRDRLHEGRRRTR